MPKFYKMYRLVLENSREYYEVKTHKLFMFYSNNFTLSEEAVLSAIDEILWLLKDGKWHDLKEITEQCSLPNSKVKMAVSFLWEYDFIQVNENTRKAKLRPLILKFIDEIQRVEREEVLTHKDFEGAVGVEEFESLRRRFKEI